MTFYAWWLQQHLYKLRPLSFIITIPWLHIPKYSPCSILKSPPWFPKCVLCHVDSNQDANKVHKSCLVGTFLYFLWILQSLSSPPASASLFSYYWLAEETGREPMECPAFWNCLITCSLSHLPWFLTPAFPVSWKLNKIQLKHFLAKQFHCWCSMLQSKLQQDPHEDASLGWGVFIWAILLHTQTCHELPTNEHFCAHTRSKPRLKPPSAHHPSLSWTWPIRLEHESAERVSFSISCTCHVIGRNKG